MRSSAAESDASSPHIPRSLSAARREAAHCKRCPLYRNATQTVFGAGPAQARIVMIGEQPGDHEDLEGKPFVGPAGRLLDEALVRVGIDRRTVYVTNAVKHFKWTPQGKRRLHQKPNAREIAACRLWLDAELTLIKPEIVVALGATAAQSLMGRTFRVTQSRGRVFPLEGDRTFVATYHPSAVLRAPPEQREKMLSEFIADLKTVANAL